MENWLEPWLKKYVALITSAVVVLGAYQWIGWTRLATSDWAAWVQAFGSVAAIGIAIYISQRQHRFDLLRDEIKDRLSVKRMTQSVHDELEDTLRNYQENFFPFFRSLQQGGFFNGVIATSHADLPIYSSCLSRIGDISDNDIRKEIIKAHAAFSFLGLTINEHNQALLRYENLIIESKKSVGIEVNFDNARHQQEMSERSHELKEIIDVTEKKIIRVLPILSAYANSLE